MAGTRIEATVTRVVDGDTIRVALPPDVRPPDPDGRAKPDVSLRILALDTEEVHASTKPKTPLGARASERAKALIAVGDAVTLEFPGVEPPAQAVLRYRDNFDRLLCYVHLGDGADFQEIMIREGLSPYFTKYGFAEFDLLHARYRAAERAAQRAEGAEAGVWDQIANNGQVFRNYAALCVWWELRARVIEGYRLARKRFPEAPLLNSRLDFARLEALAAQGASATVFMELRSFVRAGGNVIFETGSQAQPFTLFVPDADGAAGQRVMRLLLTRYVAGGEETPRRSYAYVSGALSLFRGRPQVTVRDADQIADDPGAAIAGVIDGL